MKTLNEIKANNKIKIIQSGEDGGWAKCEFTRENLKSVKLFVIFSWGLGWDHVSISLEHRCPTWEEMCFIKESFFYDEECVVQYHPKKSEYVKRHPYCLHLWKQQGVEYITPPKILVG